MRKLSIFLFGLSVVFVVLMGVCLIYGFPLPVLEETPFRVKKLKKLFEFAFIFFSLGVLSHPRRRDLLLRIKSGAEGFAQSPEAIWIVAGVYFLLFLWQQITKVLALEINFIPFLFYDYMLWYFDQGKFCYTGLLHGYYHANLILLTLYPLWKLIQSPWLLHIAHPFLTALAAVPFFYWAKEKVRSPLAALLAAFLYLNFRYVQNLLHVNFAVEVFYPLLLFSAVYFASRRNNWGYYLSVVLGLLVKEDSAVYFGCLGLFFLFSKEDRIRGIWTFLLAASYPVFLLKVFFPWSGSDILAGDLRNYRSLGAHSVHELLLSGDRLGTLFKLTSRLLFLPFASPWIFLTLAAMIPLFFQGGEYFVQLSFYYVAPVLPFLFLGLVDGWRRVEKLKLIQKFPQLQWGIVIALILLNGMNLRPLHFTVDDLKTIELGKKIPPESIVVTQGHLLPYLGYRRWNFYYAPPFKNHKDPKLREAFHDADYYFFDFEANAYPNPPEALRKEGDTLKKDPRWRIVYEDHRRLLLQNVKRVTR